MSRQEELIEAALKNQSDIEVFKRSDAYKLLIVPLEEELNKLKHSYDCKTIQELATLKGRRDGLAFVLDLIIQATEEGTRAQEANEKLQAKKRLDEMEMDSRDL